MVHRIHNRNPGYSDFATNGATASFSFSNNDSNPISHGANALKLENEVVSKNFNESVDEVNNQYHQELIKDQKPKRLSKILLMTTRYLFHKRQSLIQKLTRKFQTI